MPTAPYQIVSGPVTIYTATAGTAAPEISATPPAAWSQFGANGSRSYGDDGVTITPEQTIEEQMVLGSTAPQKAYRTEEHLTITVPMLDLTAEALALAMNGKTVADTAAGSGTGGYRSFDLLRGLEVNELAVLVRGHAPYADGTNAQYWIPRAYVGSVGEYSYAKGEGAMYEVEFMALEDSTNGFGSYQAQDAAPN